MHKFEALKGKYILAKGSLKFLPSIFCHCSFCIVSSYSNIVLFSVIAEIGDFDESEDREHLKTNQYLPNQERIEAKILEFHRKHV